MLIPPANAPGAPSVPTQSRRRAPHSESEWRKIPSQRARRAASVAILYDHRTGLGPRDGPRGASIGQRRITGQVCDHVAVETREERVSRDPEALGDALHLDVAVGIMVAHECVLRIEPCNDIRHRKRRPQLTKAPGNCRRYVGDAIRSKLGLQAAAVVRGAGELQHGAGWSTHDSAAGRGQAAAFATASAVSGRAARNAASSSASFALAAFKWRSFT